MSDTTLDEELRRIAEALVADAPQAPPMPKLAPGLPTQRPALRTNSRRPLVWVAAAAALVAVAMATATVVEMRGWEPSGPVLATVDAPGQPSTSCGEVDERLAPAADAARVRFEPSNVPAAYTRDGEPLVPFQQIRDAPASQCWTAGITLVDISTSRMLHGYVSREGSRVDPECDVAQSFHADRCVTVNGVPAGLRVDGEQRTLIWPGPDGEFVSLSGYRLSEDELVASAETFAWTADDVTLDPPKGMIEVDGHAGGTAGTTTIHTAMFVRRSHSGAPEGSVRVRVSTNGHLAVTDPGPITTVDVAGVTGFIIGAPGFPAERQWTGAENGPKADWPGRVTLMWKKDGLDFSVDGPDAATVTTFARLLRPA